MVDESVLSKTGPELFRELLRIYSVAEVEHYFKKGVWRNDVMKHDLQLVAAHRREAGAPDPPDLEDVPMPELPQTTPVGIPAMEGIRPVGSATILGAFTLQRPPTPLSTTPVAAPATITPLAEFQLVEAFIEKFQLEPTRAKLVLANVPQLRRRFLIQNFQTNSTGAAAMNALVQYIALCERDPPGAAVAPAVAAAAAAVAAAGIKRPINMVVPPNPLFDPSKRPRFSLVTRITPGKAVVVTPPTTIRPLGTVVFPPHSMRPTAPKASTNLIKPVAPTAGRSGSSLIRSLLQL